MKYAFLDRTAGSQGDDAKWNKKVKDNYQVVSHICGI